MDEQLTLSGWGGVPRVAGTERRSENLAQLTEDAHLTRGLGRSYGDASLPISDDRVVAGSAFADRILSFDPDTGVLTAEAGVSLAQLYEPLLPRGFFVPVTPGTRFVTLGGMVAADVHGKNHHRDGTFGRHVEQLVIRTGTGEIVHCSPTAAPDLFFATIGGMGLTGHILEVTVRMARVPSSWILQDVKAIASLDEFVPALKGAGAQWPMTVGWIDAFASGRTLGRGVLLKGRWAEASEAPQTQPPAPRALQIPPALPRLLMKPAVLRTFNALYEQRRARGGQRVVSPISFFYPLDSIVAWNRFYGPRGFIQYQCVIPDDNALPALRELFTLLQRRNAVPFLSVIKDCGEEGQGTLSFPMPGVTVAMDLKMTDDMQAIVDEMNAIVRAGGGRVYLAKDALTRAEDYRAMDPRVDAFLLARRKWDPHGTIRSAMSVRLFGW